jgi:hypothetical protein
VKKSPKRPPLKSAKQRARDEQMRKILQDAELKKFDPDLARAVIPAISKPKPAKTR